MDGAKSHESNGCERKEGEEQQYRKRNWYNFAM
jgi:hypothetical protein